MDKLLTLPVSMNHATAVRAGGRHVHERSHISVQVIAGSVGAHPGLAGAFMIASCDGKPDIMYIDAVEGQTMERNALVRKFAIAFDLIRSEALPASASRETTLKAAEERWKT